MKFWYHVTYSRALPAIAEGGLRPGRGQAIGRGAVHQQRSRGKTFLTEWEGVGFWFWKAEDWAENSSDAPFTDGLTPVALRVPADVVSVWLDEVGTLDAGAKAIFTEEIIPAEDVEVWNGSEWVSVDDEVDLAQAYTFEQEDGDTLEYFKQPSPLQPRAR